VRFHAFASEAASEVAVRRRPVSALQSSQQLPHQGNTLSHYEQLELV
jgi:hypothetical protein